jgi:hypothetical protein
MPVDDWSANVLVVEFPFFFRYTVTYFVSLALSSSSLKV